MFKYLVLNHIPRCGGSSLRQSFFVASKTHDYFGSYPIYISGHSHGNICLYDNPHYIQSIHKDTLMFIDHSPAFFIEQAFNLNISETYRMLTIRNPIDRFISHIHFFYKQHIDSISKLSLQNQIDKFGHMTINYLTMAHNKHKDKSLNAKYKISQSLLKEYNFIFQVENQHLMEQFNSTNPFAIHIPNFHTNHSPIDSTLPVLQKTKNFIYKNIKLEIKLLEEFYEMDI